MVSSETIPRRGAKTAETPATLTTVIVNWNSGSFLKACVNSVPETVGRFPVQLIVVDNASRDGSTQFLEQEPSRARFIQSGQNLGFGRANNLAKSSVRPGYVLFLNPDTVLKENTLACMLDFMEAHEDVGAMGCRMMFPDGEVADQNLQWFPNPLTEFVALAFLTYGIIKTLEGVLPWRNPMKSGYVRKLFGGCLMVRTAVLDQVGWFDERFFMYAEDVDLSRRIREAGWKLFYSSEAEIMHAAGGATRKAGRDFAILMGCESMAQLIEKYQGPVAGLSYRCAVAAASAFRLCFLTALLLLGPMLPDQKRISCRHRAAEWRLRFKWALRWQRAFQPDGPPS